LKDQGKKFDVNSEEKKDEEEDDDEINSQEDKNIEII